MNVESTDITFEASDGVPLAGTLYGSGVETRDALLINSALATPRSFYGPLAEWFAGQGWEVLTFDYRGIGDSRSGPVEEAHATLGDWARRDIPGALARLRSDGRPGGLYVLGHSLGGQVMGLLGEDAALDGMVTVSAQSGYWKLQHPGQRWKLFLAAWILFPALNGWCGYLPWKRLYGGENIPAEAARQWYRWCRHPNYLLGDEALDGRGGYRRFSAPILAYSFEDDVWGYREAVDRMMDAYTRAEITRVHLDPDELGVESIGHFGFFDPEMEPLWEDLLGRVRAL